MNDILDCEINLTKKRTEIILSGFSDHDSIKLGIINRNNNNSNNSRNN